MCPCLPLSPIACSTERLVSKIWSWKKHKVVQDLLDFLSGKAKGINLPVIVYFSLCFCFTFSGCSTTTQQTWIQTSPSTPENQKIQRCLFRARVAVRLIPCWSNGRRLEWNCCFPLLTCRGSLTLKTGDLTCHSSHSPWSFLWEIPKGTVIETVFPTSGLPFQYWDTNHIAGGVALQEFLSVLVLSVPIFFTDAISAAHS